MDKKKLILAVAGGAVKLSPVSMMGDVYDVVKEIIDSIYSNDKVKDPASSKEMFSIVNMAKKMNVGFEKEDITYIDINFNRILNDKELNVFFDVQEFEKAYEDSNVEMESIFPTSDNNGVRVTFQEEMTVSEGAVFAIFIDKYIRKYFDNLFIESVSIKG